MPPVPRKNRQPKPAAAKPAAAITSDPTSQPSGQDENQQSEATSTKPAEVPTPEPTNPPSDQGELESLIVASKVEGFRRAGRAWSKSPTTVLVSELSREQILQLTAEPMLVVEVAQKVAE